MLSDVNNFITVNDNSAEGFLRVYHPVVLKINGKTVVNATVLSALFIAVTRFKCGGSFSG
jgi:hypothetical protein